jgi:tetratricopeptide (TPR) repeat protein
MVIAALALAAAGCASQRGANTPPVSGLLTLEEALAEITAAVEARVEQGTQVGIAKIDAPLPEISDFLYNELLNSLGSSGKLTPLAGGKDMETLDAEHKRQTSLMVDDKSAVGIGYYLGAKVMIICSFSRFGNFSQLSARALDVKTGAVLASRRPRIRNDDPILAGLTAPLKNLNAAPITEDALAYLNRGRDYGREGKYDEAIAEFNKALSINGELGDAFIYRGAAYGSKGDYDRAITDCTAALRINPNNADAYYNRGVVYGMKGDYDRAIADLTAALRINPNAADAYYNRGLAYGMKGDYDRAIADYTAALRINTNFAEAYRDRGAMYAFKGDYDRAIADYTAALRINTNFAEAYYNRGGAYGKIGRAHV